MLINKIIDVKWNNKNRSHYESLGYVWNGNNKIIKIPTSELPKGSNVKVDYICDYCNHTVSVKYQKYANYNRYIVDKDCCSKCRNLKTEESNLKNYGVKSTLSLEDVNNKIKDSMMSIYGEKGLKSEELTNKSRDSRILNYFNTTLKNLYNDNNCKLLSNINEYNDGNKSLLRYVCSCGNESIKKFCEFRRNPRCQKCIENDVTNSSFSKVVQFINDNSSCKLVSTIDDYKNMETNLEFECKCGKVFKTNFLNFNHENKRQCNDCGIKSRIGEGHHNWKGGVTPENYRARATSNYHNWRDSVYKRDGYTCKCCGDSKGGNLNAHHIENFSDNIDLRFDINNGITLCTTCHNKGENSFHSIYGTKDNTREQLEEFLKSHKSK